MRFLRLVQRDSQKNPIGLPDGSFAVPCMDGTDFDIYPIGERMAEPALSAIKGLDNCCFAAAGPSGIFVQGRKAWQACWASRFETLPKVVRLSGSKSR